MVGHFQNGANKQSINNQKKFYVAFSFTFDHFSLTFHILNIAQRIITIIKGLNPIFIIKMSSNPQPQSNKKDLNKSSSFSNFWNVLFPCMMRKDSNPNENQTHSKLPLNKHQESVSSRSQEVEKERAYKNRQIHRKSQLNQTADPQTVLEKTKIEYDDDVEDFFCHNPVEDQVVHQHVLITQYQQSQLLLFGEQEKVLFSINSKVLKMSEALAEKTMESLNKIKMHPPNFPNRNVEKCWKKRYLLFEKFDFGIKFDEESYISTPPQPLTSYLSSRLKFDRVVHVSPGVGAYDIKLANNCESVIVTNLNANTKVCLENNLQIYAIDNVEIITDDFTNVQDLDADAVLITPPWGKNYSLQCQHNIQEMDIEKLFSKALSITPNIVMVLPSNIDPHKLAALLGKCLDLSSGRKNINSYESCTFQIEKIYFLNRVRFIVVYYGSSICTRVKLGDELNRIYQIIGNDSMAAKRLAKIIREQYGMYYLLKLCLRSESKQGPSVQRLIEIIKAQNLIPQNKLDQILNNKCTSTNQVQRMTYKTDRNSESFQDKGSKFTKKTVTESYVSFYEPTSGLTNVERNTINVRVTSKPSIQVDSKLSCNNVQGQK